MKKKMNGSSFLKCNREGEGKMDKVFFLPVSFKGEGR